MKILALACIVLRALATSLMVQPYLIATLKLINLPLALVLALTLQFNSLITSVRIFIHLCSYLYSNSLNLKVIFQRCIYVEDSPSSTSSFTLLVPHCPFSFPSSFFFTLNLQLLLVVQEISFYIYILTYTRRKHTRKSWIWNALLDQVPSSLSKFCLNRKRSVHNG